MMSKHLSVFNRDFLREAFRGIRDDKLVLAVVTYHAQAGNWSEPRAFSCFSSFLNWLSDLKPRDRVLYKVIDWVDWFDEKMPCGYVPSENGEVRPGAY